MTVGEEKHRLLDDLRALWRAVEKYEKVFKSDVMFAGMPAERWYNAMKRVAIRIKKMSPREVRWRAEKTQAVATLMREELRISEASDDGLLSGVRWR